MTETRLRLDRTCSSRFASLTGERIWPLKLQMTKWIIGRRIIHVGAGRRSVPQACKWEWPAKWPQLPFHYIYLFNQSSSHCIKPCRHGQMICGSNRASEDKNGQESDSEHDIIARQPGLRISEAADILGFLCTSISRVYREGFDKEKKLHEQQCSGPKSLADVSSQRRQFQADIWTHNTPTPWRRATKAANDHIECHSVS